MHINVAILIDNVIGYLYVVSWQLYLSIQIGFFKIFYLILKTHTQNSCYSLFCNHVSNFMCYFDNFILLPQI